MIDICCNCLGATLRWNQTFVTIDSTSLSKPNGIAIDPVTLSVFVADKDNNRVLKFLPGVTNGQIVADNSGPAITQLEKPTALAWLNNTGELFIADVDNHRIMRILTSNSSLAATRVAGIGTDGTSLSEMKKPSRRSSR